MEIVKKGSMIGRIQRYLLQVESNSLDRGFLWCQGDMKKGKAKVAWDNVCLPKDEVGLGIRRLEPFNQALIATHIWSLLSFKESLWVKWIHTYKMQGRSLWDISLRSNMSWGWQKILQVRPLVRHSIWFKLGDSSKNVAKVKDVISEGSWSLEDMEFLVVAIWESIRPRSTKEPLAEVTKGAPHLGPERPRVYSDLSPKEKDRGQDNAIDDDVDEQHVQDLALNVDNVFQTDDYNAFKSDVDEAPIAQTMFMANLASADPVYDEAGPSYDSDILSEVAIGYKNPLCLTHAKQVQAALYNGHEIIKDNHVLAIVHNTEDTLEIAEITKRKMNDKMKDPECVNHKVKIAPHDYSKENFLATFTPHKQLTPEHIFWSQDLIKMKTEALKEQTTASRPIKVFMVYPPNTPATLVPRVLLTKSQVKIHIFTLIQLFLEFDKTCKKRITPIGLTEGEGDFEQTKKCYLKEVIPFIKTLTEHFEGIQKALTKEIKEMKDVFEELEAEVAQNIVDRKHDEIERKNLLIEKNNLIVECLSKEVLSIATNSELNVTRFTEMHVAHTIVEARCLKLEAELSNLRGKSHSDNHNELVNRFSNLEVQHLNLQLKYQNLKDSFGNNPPTPAKDTFDFDSVFVIKKMQASLHGKENVVKQLKKKISHLQETHSEADCTFIVRGLDSQITQLTEKITVLQAQNDLFRAENEKIKYHYKEFVSKDHVKPTVLAPEKYAIDVEPIPSYLRHNWDAHLDYLRHLKENVETIHDIVEEAKVKNNVNVPPSTRVNRCIDANGSQPRSNTKKIGSRQLKVSRRCCSKHMTGDRSRLINFMKKFIGAVRFENDHFGAIMGYGHYVIGDSVISRVKFLRLKDETPEVVIKFLQQIQLGLNKTTVPKTPQQNGVVERQNRMLVEAARTTLIFSKALMFLWAEAVATACYTQNRSLIHTRHNKTPYELVHNKKPDLAFFRVFVALCYPTNASEDLGKLQPIADIRIFVGYAPSRKGPAPIFLTPGQIRSGLVPNPVPVAPYVPPTNKDLEILFKPMFDEYLELHGVDRPVTPAPAVQASVNSAGTPSSTIIDQDATSLSISLSSSALPSHSLHQGVAAESTFMKDNPVALVDNNPFINVFAPEPSSDASSSGDVSSIESTYISQTLHHLSKWSKDHPLDNVIGNLSRLIAGFKPCKKRFTNFDRLQVWELVPQPDCVMIIALKWIYKVKLDEYSDVLKNKARLVAKGY
nr:putative reverse transcriptase zinc-binding domain-containing protein [Tanacetum cinerariifolium]